MIIVDSSQNDDDDAIVIWGHNRGDEDCPRDFRPESNKFKKNIIIAKSCIMFKIGDGATAGNNTYRDNKLHDDGDGSADRGNMPNYGISHDEPTTEGRAPRESLEESDVGPLSERSDQPVCSREELGSLTGQRCS